jgi:hypothetical protein
MTANLAMINRYAAGARLYVFADVPADGALMTHTAGVPAGFATRELGATVAASGFEYKPAIALTDIEQFFGSVAPRLTGETATLKATLGEASAENVELALQQAQVPNILSAFNSSFEVDSNADGTADNWNVVGTATRTIQVDAAPGGGTKSQQFLAGTGVPGGIVSDAVAHPRLVAGAIALFSAYLKAASGTPTARLKLEAFNSTNVSQGSNTFSGAITTAFVRYSVLFTLPANTAYVKVTADDATGQNIAIKVDNVQLEVVPLTSSVPSPYVPQRGAFVGGRTDVQTYTVALMSKQTDTAFYNWVFLYAAFASDGAPITFKRGEVRAIPLTFYGLPVVTRTAGDQLFQMVEEK